MTNIGVFSMPYQSEDRSWLLTELEDAYKQSATLSIAAFTQATHFPNYYIPSGTALGVITASSTGGAIVVGPYDDTAADGRETCIGYLASSTLVVNPMYQPLANVGVAIVQAFAAVNINRLPFNSTNAATGRGYIDANGEADLPRIHHVAL
jgi:hypothetical protein